jgi:hypothetical protein
MGIFEDSVSMALDADEAQARKVAAELFRSRAPRLEFPFSPADPDDGERQDGADRHEPRDDGEPSLVTDPDSLFAARFFASDSDFAPGGVYTETT